MKKQARQKKKLQHGVLDLILAAKPPVQFIPYQYIHPSLSFFAIPSMYIDFVSPAHSFPYRISSLEPPGQLAPYRYIQDVQPLTPRPVYSVPLHSGCAAPDPLASLLRTATFRRYTAQEPVLRYK